MAATDWPLFSRFNWRVSLPPTGYTEGYCLQGGAIVARGPALPSGGSSALLGTAIEDQSMRAYCPDDLHDMAHREFMALEMGDNEGLLAFVNEYGLLGLDGGGPPKRESLAHLWLAHSNLWIYRKWAHDDPAILASERNEAFNNLCPQHMSVHLERENRRTILKVSVGSLVAWMWLRLAQEVVGEIKLKTCKLPSCGRQWYEGRNLSSSRREYCNPDCKAAHHYGMKTGKFSRDSKPTQEGGLK